MNSESAAVIVNDGIVSKVLQLPDGLSAAEKKSVVTQQAGYLDRSSQSIHDYGHAVVSPGLIDVHVHMDEPGREHWEGTVRMFQAIDTSSNVDSVLVTCMHVKAWAVHCLASVLHSFADARDTISHPAYVSNTIAAIITLAD